MGNIVFITIAIIILIQLFYRRGYIKLYWFFGAILFFPQTIILFERPYMSFPRFVILSLFFVTILNYKKFKEDLYLFHFKRLFKILFLLLLLIGLLDSRLDIFLRIYRPVSYFIESFAIMLFSFIYISSIDDANKIYHFIIVCMIIFSIYGIVNYITGGNEYSSLISDIYRSRDFATEYNFSGSERYRIASFAWHPIYYGLLLSITILLIVFYLYGGAIKIRGVYLFSLLLLFLNLLWTNSRTPIAAFICGSAFFLAFGISMKSKFRLLFVGIFVAAIVVSFFPKSFSIIDETINTFSKNGSKYTGSSVEMRDAQLAASFLLFNKSPYFGNGFGYISEDLGFSGKGTSTTKVDELYGFESYMYKLLIEQGIAGIVGNLIFFGTIFSFLIKVRKKVSDYGRSIVYITISMCITFLFFIFGTGDLGAFMFFMALLGVNFRVIILSKKQEMCLNYERQLA